MTLLALCSLLFYLPITIFTLHSQNPSELYFSNYQNVLVDTTLFWEDIQNIFISIACVILSNKQEVLLKVVEGMLFAINFLLKSTETDFSTKEPGSNL